MLHLTFPGQRLTECARTALVNTTDVVARVTCKTCLRRYIQRLTLQKKLLTKKEGAP